MSRSFALVPAAGHSLRMGRPKLLLPVAGQPLILHTLAAWKRSRVDRIAVVVRPDDSALAEIVQGAGVDSVMPPAAPPDMKASLACGLAHIAANYHPLDSDTWLAAPADMPGLSSQVIDRLLGEAVSHEGQIIIPTLEGRAGHPVLLPWSLAGEISRLQPQEGLNSLIDRCQPRLVACDDLATSAQHAFADIDTPDDLQDWSNQALRPSN
ncbi:MAG: nucleotidyltransferase family protein [Planctomycetaceae bacterium]|nr:nucleotidyltransferase family protein [Planctomycetaceae bacterium]